MKRRAKIAGTLGPSCEKRQTMERLIDAGMDVARLNFSHGLAAEHQVRIGRLRRAARKYGRSVALMADLQGPRFRVGEIPGGSMALEDGAHVDVVAGAKKAAAGKLPVAYAALARDVRRGDAIRIDDGKIELRVERVRGDVIRCVVVRGGVVTDRKGINLPGVELSVPTITPKDRRDLRFAVEAGADWLAISFVRRGEDVRQAKRLLRRAGRELPVMAKIERPEAIDALDDILEQADGVLVARGDLGVELATEDVPILQKQIIDAANARGKTVMTATQMLESMRYSSRPTRAEASDVANAVLDGSSSLLLTAETAAGQYPVEAVRTMASIIGRAERAGLTHEIPELTGDLSIPTATSHAAVRAAIDVGATHLVAFTTSGTTACQVARFRPPMPIIACTPSEEVARQLNVQWGVDPVKVRQFDGLEEMIKAVDRALLKKSLARPGQIVVVLAGSPIGVPGTTNVLKVHRVGSTLPTAGARVSRARK
jgi:pyruvate kinase